MTVDVIDDFVKNNLDYSIIRKYKDRSAVIHEPIHGSQYFFGHELAVLDQPLVQRLRDISQVDVVPYIYPSGNHNRLEHTIGVVAVADQMLKALRLQKTTLVDDGDIYNIRMAAILHDCGHGVFSHASEQIFKKFPMFATLISDRPKYQQMHPHEALSCAIVTSDSFRGFISEVNHVFQLNLDLQFIADSIGGLIRGQQAYLSGIINGPLDADKLDYIQRDSYFTGIRMSLDLDRLFYALRAITHGDNRVLGVDISGISALEQIVFSKMMLFNSVYHHHQVRAAGCLIKDAITSAMEYYSIDSMGMFLGLTDSDIVSLGGGCHADNELFLSMHNLKRRKLLKRALVICKDSISSDGLGVWWDLIKDDRRGKQEEMLQGAIRSLSGIERVWVDMPTPPNFSEANKCVVSRPKENQALRDFFPIDGWTTAFAQNKYKAFVFCEEEAREEVHVCAKEAIKDAFGITFNDNASHMCRM